MSRKKLEALRVCTDKDCTHNHEPQPIENFITSRNGKRSVRTICKSCMRRKSKAWYSQNKKSIAESRVWISDQDTATDLVPMNAGGYVRWAVITETRRRALGEKSPYNGLSIARDREKE